MTRYLSLALGARQPVFGQTIAALEQASGLPAADIRLNAEIAQVVKRKIAELGLDPQDTTGEELYVALQNKMSRDEAVFDTALGIEGSKTATEVLSVVQKYLTKHEKQSCFALKPTVAKQLLKKKPPKVVMKKLGYRSLDSMLRHEQPAHLYAAAQMFESYTWRKVFYAQYTKLKATDFEQKNIAVSLPTGKKWESLADEYVETYRHNIISLKELGQVVLLPMANRLPALGIMTFLLAVHFMNEIHTYSSYVKLQQVKPDFGEVIARSVESELHIPGQLAGRPVSWDVVQRYYGRAQAVILPPSSFEPHIQAEDLSWRDAEDALAEVDESLGFWRDTQYICTLSDDKPVSLNLIDVVMNRCNHISFGERLAQFAREHLWSELMSRYMHASNLESSVQQELTGNIA